jgi:hypothetical protein
VEDVQVYVPEQAETVVYDQQDNALVLNQNE